MEKNDFQTKATVDVASVVSKKTPKPMRLAPVETSTTTEPEQLSGETYTYTHFKNTITMVSETRVYNSATNEYDYEYADNETVYVHLEHESDITPEQMVNLLKDAALVLEGGEELVTLQDESTYYREFTGGYIISTYDSEGWLIGRETQEIRDGNNVVIASSHSPSFSPYPSQEIKRVWNPAVGKMELRDSTTDEFISYESPTSADDAMRIVNFSKTGLKINKGIRFVIKNCDVEQRVATWTVTKFSIKYFAKVAFQVILKCSRFLGIVGLIWNILDYGTLAITWLFTNNPTTLSELATEALFGGEGSQTGSSPNGGNSGGGSGGGSSFYGGWSYDYTEPDEGMTFNLWNMNNGLSGETGNTPVKLSYVITHIQYQTTQSYYDPDYGWGVAVTMHNIYFPFLDGMSDFIYNTPGEAGLAVGMPNGFAGLSNYYIIYYDIYEEGNPFPVGHGHTTYTDETFTTTPESNQP